MSGSAPKLVKSSRITLRSIPGFSEEWLEKILCDEPERLGLGHLKVIERQRRHQNAGRLDLLLQDAEGERRYEVELMLGQLDESHMVRAIEYWDIERRRYPGYEHICVIVAEDITSRFLNVLGLFSGTLPLIAIQVSALQVEDKTTFTFLKVLESVSLRKDDESEAVSEASTHDEWVKWAGADNMQLVDQCITYINAHATRQREAKYNASFIGLYDGGRANNFVRFEPTKTFVWLRAKVNFEKWKNVLSNSGLVYEGSEERIWLKLKKGLSQADWAIVKSILSAALTLDESAG